MKDVVTIMLQDLSEVTLFRDIPKNEFAGLLPLFKVRQFNKNHNLIFENDQTDEVYFIRSGMVKVYRIKDNQELVFNFHIPGDVVGEVEAIYDKKDNYRMASIEAIESVTAWVLTKSDFLHIIDTYPVVLRRAYVLLAERLRVMNRKLRSIAFDDTRTRSADLLLDLYYNYGVEQDDGYKINMKLPQSILADMLGITRESISKIINEFKRDGIIAIRERYMCILNLEQLQLYCNDSEDPMGRKWNS